MTEEDGVQWVRGTIRAVMVKRRITFAELAKRLRDIGLDENERALRNKVARGTFSAVFFVQCLEAIGLDSLKLDMTKVMAEPESEREFAADVFRRPTEKRLAEMDAILASIRESLGPDYNPTDIDDLLGFSKSEKP